MHSFIREKTTVLDDNNMSVQEISRVQCDTIEEAISAFNSNYLIDKMMWKAVAPYSKIGIDSNTDNISSYTFTVDGVIINGYISSDVVDSMAEELYGIKIPKPEPSDEEQEKE